ncbi:hypothetical protein GCM10029992_06150 [Glycomyces albus]
MVYNKALDARTKAWYRRKERVGYVETSALLTKWKQRKDLDFLNEVSSVPLQQALRHLQKGFAHFFEQRTGYPCFKRKRVLAGSAEYTKSAFTFRGGELKLAKHDAPLKIRWSRALPHGAVPSTVTVSRDAAGRWFVSLLVEADIPELPERSETVGIDAGLTSLFTLSTGERVTNPGMNAATARRSSNDRKTSPASNAGRRTIARPRFVWLAHTRGSRIGGMISCTSSPLGWFAKTKRSRSRT